MPNWCGNFTDSIALRELMGVPTDGYSSCAIVGSSGVLGLERLGELIDEAEFVMRFNLNPVRGYEEIAGSFTTLRALNSESLDSIVRNQCDAMRDAGGDRAATESHNASWCPSYPVILNSHRPMHSEAFRAACQGHTTIFDQSILAEHEAVVEFLGPPSANLMSGQLGVAITTMLCPNGVDVYGFTHDGVLEVLDSRDVSYHYYENRSSSPSDHLDESARLLSELAATQPDCVRLWSSDLDTLQDRFDKSQTGPRTYGDPLVDNISEEDMYARLAHSPAYAASPLCQRPLSLKMSVSLSLCLPPAPLLSPARSFARASALSLFLSLLSLSLHYLLRLLIPPPPKPRRYVEDVSDVTFSFRVCGCGPVMSQMRDCRFRNLAIATWSRA